MIRYYLYQWQAKGNLQGLWFARAASDETLNLEALSEHMHSHNCPYSQGTILGVLRISAFNANYFKSPFSCLYYNNICTV